jgi:hypothetical protein
METEHPYKECNECKYITDCNHATVDHKGTPEEPKECQKKGKIKIEQNPDGV